MNGQREAMSSVTFEFVDKSEIEIEERNLQERLDTTVTIEGTQSFHAFYPLKDSTNKLTVKSYSHSSYCETVKVSNHQEPIPFDDISGYVICQYGGAWWLAAVLKTNPDTKEAELQFMHPAGTSPSFYFP